MRDQIAGILKARRKSAGLSVKDTLNALKAQGIDVSDKTLYGWESGHRQPDADTFLILCEIYGIETISEITENGASPRLDCSPVDESAPPDPLTADMEKLLQSLTREQALLLFSIAARWMETVKAKAAQD